VSPLSAGLAGLLSIFLSFIAQAESGTPSLFGISLGQNIAEIPVCPFIPNTLHFNGTELCLIESSKISKAWGAEEFNVNLPPERPSYLSNMYLAAVQGKIVEVVVGTRGLRYRKEVYGVLQEKFGDPISVETDLMQNIFGTEFTPLSARWRLKNSFLEMYGAESSTDNGAIYLSDNEYSKRVDQYTNARENKLKP
jgi:hypothetical protein